MSSSGIGQASGKNSPNPYEGTSSSSRITNTSSSKRQKPHLLDDRAEKAFEIAQSGLKKTGKGKGKSAKQAKITLAMDLEALATEAHFFLHSPDPHTSTTLPEGFNKRLASLYERGVTRRDFWKAVETAGLKAFEERSQQQRRKPQKKAVKSTPSQASSSSSIEASSAKKAKLERSSSNESSSNSSSIGTKLKTTFETLFKKKEKAKSLGPITRSKTAAAKAAQKTFKQEEILLAKSRLKKTEATPLSSKSTATKKPLS